MRVLHGVRAAAGVCGGELGGLQGGTGALQSITDAIVHNFKQAFVVDVMMIVCTVAVLIFTDNVVLVEFALSLLLGAVFAQLSITVLLPAIMLSIDDAYDLRYVTPRYLTHMFPWYTCNRLKRQAKKNQV